MRTLGCVSCSLVLAGAMGLATGALPAALVSQVWAQELPSGSTRSDLSIESDVLHALAAAGGLSGQQISASTENGVVTLSGSVARSEDRGLAEKTAAGVAGVRSVVNKISVGGTQQAAPSSDASAAEDAATVAAAEGDPAQPEPVTQAQAADAGAGRKPSPAIPAQAESQSPVPPEGGAQSTAQAQPQTGAQGDWGQAGPPPDVQDGRIPPPTADAGAPAPQEGKQGQYPAPPNQGQGQEQGNYPAQGQLPPAGSGQYPPGTGQGQYPPAGSGTSYPTGRQRTSGYPPQSQPGYPQDGSGYPGSGNPNSGYPQNPSGYPGPRSAGPGPAGQQSPIRPYPEKSYPGQPYPGQSYPGQQQSGRGPVGYAQPGAGQYQAALPVTIPAGTLLRVRTSEPLDTRRLQPGDVFEVMATQDVFEGGVLAVPRGATLVGRVVDVKKAGAFRGSAGMALQLVSLNVSGQSFPLATDVFATDTRGKGGYTAANTAGAAVVGALIGAAAGGGEGAAIGAVAGGAAGAGASAATPGPRQVMPPETVLAFHLAAPLTVIPPSYAEAQRLAASVAPRRPYLRPRPYGYPAPPPPYGYPY